MIRHKASKDNQVIDTLSRRARLLSTMSISVQGFKEMICENAKDKNFGPIYTDILNGEREGHHTSTCMIFLFFIFCRKTCMMVICSQECNFAYWPHPFANMLLENCMVDDVAVTWVVIKP